MRIDCTLGPSDPVEALRHTLESLREANVRGKICETLWSSPSETLFDYLERVITENGLVANRPALDEVRDYLAEHDPFPDE